MNKFFIPFNVCLPMSIIYSFFDKYIFADWEFLKFLMVLILIDTLLGVIKAWVQKSISGKEFGKWAVKLLVYVSLMVLSNVLMHFTIGGEAQTSLKWFGTFCCTMLIARESFSIVEKIETIYPGFFPSAFMKRFRDFDSETGKKIGL